jgi:phosphoglucosamine mutase
MGRLFGTDGIRGRANEYPMTAEIALRVGRATALMFKRQGHVSRIVVGKDTRVSGDMIESALAAGICSMGVNVLRVGILPTPGIAFLAGSMRADAGIVISASHNPFDDNGIKIFSGGGFKLPDEMEGKIEGLVLSGDAGALRPSSGEIGKISFVDDARGRYIVFLKGTFPKTLSLEGMRIVLDCSNGATYRVAPEAFSELGASVKTIFGEPDGRNINDHCGSQHTERLAEEVIREKAQAGFAFDGDGDRCIAVDEKGNPVTGDRMMAICARGMKEEGILWNNRVVTTVMSNLGFHKAMREMGIDLEITDVGDRYVLEKMRETGAILGGEDSGHLIFLNHQTTGDGIVTAFQVAAAMGRENVPLSRLAGVMTVYPQKLVNVPVREKRDLASVPAVMAAIEEAERQLGDRGRVLVRYSGTQNLCRVMVEGPTEEETSRHCDRISRVVQRVLS